VSIRRRLAIAALILGASVLLSRILGFVRDAIIAYTLGASAETDAYYAAFTIPDMMNYFLAGGTLSVTFIPLYSRFLTKNDEDGANHLLSVVATNIGVVLIVLVLIGEVFALDLVRLIFPGFSEQQYIRTAELTRVVLPGQLFFVLGGVIQGVLMARERFLPTALVPLIYNACIIGFGLVLSPSMGIMGFSIGALVGSFLGAFVLPLWYARATIRYRPILSFRDPQFVTYFRISVWLMLAVTLLTVDEWIARYFGSSMTEGTITFINNARRLMLVPVALIGQAASVAALPYLSKLAAESRDEDLGDTLSVTLRAAAFLSCLAAAFMALFAYPIVSAIYERGAFTSADAQETAGILLFYCAAIVAFTVQTIGFRGFFAHSDTFRPFLIGTVVTGLSLPIYWQLSLAYGARGLALALAICLTLSCLATLVVYQRKYGFLDLRGIGTSILKGLSVAAVVIAPSALLRYLFEQNPGLLPNSIRTWVELLVGAALFALAVLVSARFLGGAEGDAIRRVTRRIGSRFRKEKGASKDAP
jgi:putative peptidoglycan lipid II flippase